MSTYYTNQTYINNVIEKAEADFFLFLCSFIIIGSISKCSHSIYKIIDLWCKKRKLETIHQDLLSTSNIICSICLEDYSDIDKKISKTKCKHIFHKKCLNNWIKENNTCPECRAKIL